MEYNKICFHLNNPGLLLKRINVLYNIHKIVQYIIYPKRIHTTKNLNRWLWLHVLTFQLQTPHSINSDFLMPHIFLSRLLYRFWTWGNSGPIPVKIMAPKIITNWKIHCLRSSLLPSLAPRFPHKTEKRILAPEQQSNASSLLPRQNTLNILCWGNG